MIGRGKTCSLFRKTQCLLNVVQFFWLILPITCMISRLNLITCSWNERWFKTKGSMGRRSIFSFWRFSWIITFTWKKVYRRPWKLFFRMDLFLTCFNIVIERLFGKIRLRKKFRFLPSSSRCFWETFGKRFMT